MIQLQQVEKRYPPAQVALSNFNLRVAEGEFLFVAGASGAGKSTLLKLMLGLERPSSGEVVVAGSNVPRLKGEELARFRREIGIVFQDYRLLPRRSVVDNVALPLEVRGLDAGPRRAAALEILEMIGLADRADSSPLTLSGGEQQRVAIARALIHRPRIVLADEPTGNLDVEMTRVVFNLLLEAKASGMTVVVATHNLGIIEELNLRTVVLDRGKIIGDFSTPGF